MFYTLRDDKSIIRADEKPFDNSIELDCSPKRDYDNKLKPAIYCDDNKISLLNGYKQELSKLENWFSSYFDKQMVQSMWQPDYKPSKDIVFNILYGSIDEIIAKAESVRSRIKELRNLIKSI